MESTWLEHVTACMQSKRSTKLSYDPIILSLFVSLRNQSFLPLAQRDDTFVALRAACHSTSTRSWNLRFRIWNIWNLRFGQRHGTYEGSLRYATNVYWKFYAYCPIIRLIVTNIQSKNIVIKLGSETTLSGAFDTNLLSSRPCATCNFTIKSQSSSTNST